MPRPTADSPLSPVVALVLHSAELEPSRAERVLRPDHPGTLPAATTIADTYESRRAAHRRHPLYERVAASMQRVLGPDHPYQRQRPRR